MNNILTSIYLLIFLKFCACTGNYPNGCTLDSRWNTLNCFTTTPWANKFTSTKNAPLSYWTDPTGGRVKCYGHTIYTPTTCTASITYPSGCTMDTKCGTTLKCYTTTACKEKYTHTKCASCNYWTNPCGTKIRSCLQTVCTPTTCTVSPTYPSGCTLDTKYNTLKCYTTTACKEKYTHTKCAYCNYWTGPCGTKTKSCLQTVCTPSNTVTPIHTTSTSTTFWTGSYDTTFSTKTTTVTGTDNLITTETIYIVETPIRATSTTTTDYWTEPFFSTTAIETTTFTGTDYYETTETIFQVFVPILETTTTIYTDFPDGGIYNMENPTYSTEMIITTNEDGAPRAVYIYYVYSNGKLKAFNGEDTHNYRNSTENIDTNTGDSIIF
ncbi:hypothetical protein Kpol_304p3 [Vanderwaltozyma polyspora DSM 70294]|uniref:Flo11 domain-containing protein n=1 Tax=Vanderwaltozyma polyspora (strain ATCC 22028 / DSM 70294 / BCRC 21397 / CBS 2163 / NBRC 10782 / NRRL Y-8283 / UCD 57-17) TaxID=436907 RepID=A7TSZ5_VANPO|nr:uncharacterized protein Kpol_304p3 [Vanderwaltozyma polyspora DSM 70294]EDO14611.1 hypothetical protein Kpol_304p3 [Vanderwaltozyma polyspora DSM 70294]